MIPVRNHFFWMEKGKKTHIRTPYLKHMDIRYVCDNLETIGSTDRWIEMSFLHFVVCYSTSEYDFSCNVTKSSIVVFFWVSDSFEFRIQLASLASVHSFTSVFDVLLTKMKMFWFRFLFENGFAGFQMKWNFSLCFCCVYSTKFNWKYYSQIFQRDVNRDSHCL